MFILILTEIAANLYTEFPKPEGFFWEKNMKNKILIADVTLRDGEQTPGSKMSFEGKIKIAKELECLGVDIMEVGFPANSPVEVEVVSAIARTVKKPIIGALARVNSADIDAAWKALQYAARPRIHVFVSTSAIHLTHQIDKSQDEVIEMAVAGVKRAKRYCKDVQFSAMDATRTSPKYLYKVIEAVIEAGATTVNIPDTVGYSTPDEYFEFMKEILDEKNVPSIKKVVVSAHCHDDLGFAVANSWMAIKAGARQVEGCINGLGERAGNAALEEVIMGIKIRGSHLNIYTGAKTTKITPISQLAQKITGIPVQPNKAIVGANAFLHESGIHADGHLKHKETYQIMQKEDVGLSKKTSSLSVGKTSGRAGVKGKLEELGYKFDENTFPKVFAVVKNQTNGKTLTDEELRRVAKDFSS